MIDGECPNCGGGTFVLAKACPQCGAPLKLRMAGIMVAGALVLLLAAIVVAVVVVLRWHRLAAATETGAPADEQIVAGSTADLSWLATAMSGCDAEAKTDAGALHFLVTPLVSVAKDIEPWRAKSINDAGNGILLRSDDALDGLKSGTLRVYPADYDFSIFDQAGDTVYKWQAVDRRGEVLDRRYRRDRDLQGAVSNGPQRRRRRVGRLVHAAERLVPLGERDHHATDRSRLRSN